MFVIAKLTAAGEMLNDAVLEPTVGANPPSAPLQAYNKNVTDINFNKIFKWFTLRPTVKHIQHADLLIDIIE